MKITTIIVRILLGHLRWHWTEHLFHFIPIPPRPEAPARDFITVWVGHKFDESRNYCFGCPDVVTASTALKASLGFPSRSNSSG